MMNIVKRATALILAATAALSLAACGKTPQASSKGLSGAAIQVVIPSHPNWPYREDWASWRYVREATGADIDVVAYPNADFATKVALIMASPSDVPDLMVMPNMSLASQYTMQGALVAIDDYEDEMPNYRAFWSSLPAEVSESMLKMRKHSDGKTYYPQVYGRQNTINLRTWLYRKDIFEKNGLEIPETTDELYETGLKLKKLYPDAYPICIRGFFNNGVDLVGSEWKPNFAMGAYYDFANDKWCYGATEDTMRDIIEYFIKLERAKLIPPDYVNLTASAWSELVYTDKTFMFPQYQVQIDILNNANRSRNPEFTMAAMTPPRADTPTGQNKVAKSNVDPCGYVVCNSGDETRISNAIGLLDWFYSDEACELLSWGKEGETYEVADGKKKFILDGEENVETRYGFQTNSLIVRIEPEAVMASFSEEQRESTEDILSHTEDGYNPVRWVGLTPEEQNLRDDIGTALDSYAQEMISKFLLGKEPMSKWDEFVATLEDMGAGQIVDMYKTAYDRVK